MAEEKGVGIKIAEQGSPRDSKAKLEQCQLIQELAKGLGLLKKSTKKKSEIIARLIWYQKKFLQMIVLFMTFVLVTLAQKFIVPPLCGTGNESCELPALFVFGLAVFNASWKIVFKVAPVCGEESDDDEKEGGDKKAQ